jgi:hypothetical protein
VKDEKGFSRRITAHARLRFRQAGTQEESFDIFGIIDIHCTRYMATMVFVVEAAVNDVIIVNGWTVNTIDKFTQLIEAMVNSA